MKVKLLIPLLLGLSSAVAGVETQPVKKVSLDTKVLLDGHVEAISESTVSAQVNAKVKAIYVDVDDRVPAGKLLIELDDTELKAQQAKAQAALKVAQAQAAQAESEFQRLLGLEKESFVSANDMTRATSAVDVANANVQLAKAKIAEVKQKLSYTKIIAPYSGVVTKRHIEVGESANFGQPLLTGFALNQNRLNVQVPNSLINELDQEQSIWIKNAQDIWVELTNLTIAPSADKRTHTVMVRANINKDEFTQRPGSFITVGIATDPRESLVVPKTSVINQGDLTAVYVKNGERVLLRQVVTGQEQAGQIEILSGLQPQERVLVNGAGFLANAK